MHGRRAQHRGATAAVALGPDSRGVDFGSGRQKLGGGQNIPGAGCKGVLDLIVNRGNDAPRAEGIDSACCDSGISDRRRVGQVMRLKPQAAGNDDHHRKGPSPIGHKELGPQVQARHRLRVGNGLIEVLGIGRRNGQRLPRQPIF